MRPYLSPLLLTFSLIRGLVIMAFALHSALAHASVALTEIESAGRGPITIFYPSSSAAKRIERGPIALDVAWQGVPVRGNGRLIVISHGSGGAPWMHADLARALVEAGFVVAMPEHYADNYEDSSGLGPDSWKRRPIEVSRAIDMVGQDRRFGPLLVIDKVGMFGMSAGGHTALTLAGGRWSPAHLKQHCEKNLAEDFQGCVGLTTQLNGGVLDGLKKHVAQWILDSKLDDASWYSYSDPRIAAIVAGVPLAADFDAASLASPRIPLGIVTARKDKWLIPRFHSDAILQQCSPCERVADLPNGGHGALLSPLPPGVSGLLGDLINDPPGFDRTQSVIELNHAITAFFQKHLVQDVAKHRP